MEKLWVVKENNKKERIVKGRDLVDVIFSWSLLDVLNSNLYRGQVKKIPNTFSSTKEYFNSFINPIIEETHASLLSSMVTIRRAQAFKFVEIKPAKDFKLPRNLYYDVKLQIMSDNVETNGSQKKLEMNDLVAVTDKKPIRIDDLRYSNEPVLLALVCGVKEEHPHLITILASKPINLEDDDDDYKQTSTRRGGKSEKQSLNLFGVSLINLMTNVRIWTALHPDPKDGNLQLISRVLQRNDEVGVESCVRCQENSKSSVVSPLRTFKLNSSQEDAVLRCLEAKSCSHYNSIKLIWGPPGTGKTKTTSVLLWNLLKTRCRTLTCAPTNTAVLEVCSRLVNLVTDSLRFGGYGLGDIVLFGNKERMKIDEREDLYDVFLDYRVDELYSCFMSMTGWRANVNRMISLLNDPKEEYCQYKRVNESSTLLSFEEFVQERFNKIREDLKHQFPTLCMHLPTALLSFRTAEKMYQTNDLLRGFTSSDVLGHGDDTRKQDCVDMLESIIQSVYLPDISGQYELKRLLLEYAYLLFCTASSSAKLHMSDPIEVLVIDEAAQLKECESAIPLQLPGLQHAILIGDEKQLPAMIQSKIAQEADLERSLFERLVMLGHTKQLLKIQYRMHPCISFFPNREFYGMKILDAPSVRMTSYEKKFLPEKMYGPYSFINISNGREQFGDGYSAKNVVEVSVVAEILSKLYSGSRKTGRTISVGVISPYKAQVSAIQEKIGQKYNNSEGTFTVSVRSIDGFQGGEEDIIIISTVRSNDKGAIGFLHKQQRTNVALTRARYCLWILGNEETLTWNKSVWRQLVNNAKARDCFHEAEDDVSLAQCIERSTTALDDLDRLHNKKLPFEYSIWEVSLSNEFLRSLETIIDSEVNRRVMKFLEKLSSGELQEELETEDENLWRQVEIDDSLTLIWARDIIKKGNHFVQVLKIWHVLPSSSDVSRATEHVEKHYKRYTNVKIQRCRYICYQGDVIVPMRWPINSYLGRDIVSNISRSFALLSVMEEEEETVS